MECNREGERGGIGREGKRKELSVTKGRREWGGIRQEVERKGSRATER